MRILSLHPVATEALFAIGAGDMIVGRTDACDYPEQARAVPSVGKEITKVVVEVFEPELVVLGPGQEEFKDELHAFKTITFAPQDVVGELMVLGEIVGKQLEAEVVAHDISTLLDHVRGKAKRFKRVKVCCERCDAYVREIVVAAGGIPFEGERTPEAIQAFDPYAIIVGSEEEGELVAARDGWAQLQAVQRERIYVVPEEMLRPGPRLQDGIKRIAKLLHGIDA